MANQIGTRINDLLMSGVPVEYKASTGTLILAGEEYTIERWLETRRRIDMVLKRTLSQADWKELREKLAWLGKRDRLPQELRDYEVPARTGGGSFLERNLETISKQRDGTLKRAPWWLRWAFPLVVTKE